MEGDAGMLVKSSCKAGKCKGVPLSYFHRGHLLPIVDSLDCYAVKALSDTVGLQLNVHWYHLTPCVKRLMPHWYNIIMGRCYGTLHKGWKALGLTLEVEKMERPESCFKQSNGVTTDTVSVSLPH